LDSLNTIFQFKKALTKPTNDFLHIGQAFISLAHSGHTHKCAQGSKTIETFLVKQTTHKFTSSQLFADGTWVRLSSFATLKKQNNKRIEKNHIAKYQTNTQNTMKTTFS
jgi:exopolysaccharide biosynthesis protein